MCSMLTNVREGPLVQCAAKCSRFRSPVGLAAVQPPAALLVKGSQHLLWNQTNPMP
jgi:hypothetical protein